MILDKEIQKNLFLELNETSTHQLESTGMNKSYLSFPCGPMLTDLFFMVKPIQEPPQEANSPTAKASASEV